MDNPILSHLLAAKRILRYMKGTLDCGLLFSKSGYCDSDCMVIRVTEKYNKLMVALSSCEAEYIVASIGACQALWLDNLMIEMKIRREEPMKILIDNKLAISLAKHPVAHGRSKHIETRFHFLRDQVSKGKLELEYCNTNE
ncbi:Copia protein, partial [Mucuna pruriens]